MAYCGRCIKARRFKARGIGCGKCQQLTRLIEASQETRDEMLRYRIKPGEVSPILGPIPVTMRQNLS